MTERTPLSASSAEFARLEYFVQLSLRATTARVVQCFLLSNPHQQVNFERQAGDLLTLDSLVDCSTLGGGGITAGRHHEEDVYQRVGGGGMLFHVGQLALSEYSAAAGSNGVGGVVRSKLAVLASTSSATSATVSSTAASAGSSAKAASSVHITRAPGGDAGRTVRQFMLCRVAVGRAYACLDVAHAAKQEIPPGYHSLHIASGKHGHDYWVKGAGQVLATHLVTVEYDALAERRSREKPRCDNCENTYAAVYCAADNANLCSDCDARLHMANKVSQKHIRTAIGKGVDALGQCRSHTEQRIEFFCSQCHVPVCVHCKMVGHHSTGEAAHHKLVSVVEAFDSVMRESQMADQVLNTRRTAIHNQTEAIAQRARQIEQKQSQLEGELEQMHRQALAKLKELTEHKLTVLQSDQMELARQEQEIDALESFLEYQQTGMDAYPLLFNWAKHLGMRQSLHEFRHFRDDIDVFPDQRIAGRITVESDPAMATSMSKFSAGNAKPPPSPKKSGYASVAASDKRTAAERRSAPVRRTSAFFAETLSALEDMDLERASYVNRLLDDERSLTSSAATGYGNADGDC